MCPLDSLLNRGRNAHELQPPYRPGYIIRAALWVNCRKSSRLRRMRRAVVVFLHSLCDRICSSRPVSVVGSGMASSSGFFIHREKRTERIV